MKITQYTKKDGSIVYRSSIYLGIDSMTGKKVKTTHISTNQERTQKQGHSNQGRVWKKRLNDYESR